MKTAIITLDIINDLCHPNGKLASYASRIASSRVIEHINQITHWGREKRYLIAHVRVAFHPSYLDCSDTSPIFSKAKEKGALNRNEWGGQFCDKLHIEPIDMEIIKHRVSAFFGTDLDLILRESQIERLILTGIGTNNALELTAREGHDRDYQITLVEDATECGSDEEKEASIRFLARLAKWHKIHDLIR